MILLAFSLFVLFSAATAGQEPIPPAMTQSDVADLIAERAQAVADRDTAQKRIEELNAQLLKLDVGAIDSRVWSISQLYVDPPFKGSEKIYEMLVDSGDYIARCHGGFRGKMTTRMSVYQKFDGGYGEPTVPTDVWKTTGVVFTDSMGGLLIEGKQANEIGRCINLIFLERPFPANPSGTLYGFSFAFELH